MVDEDLAIQIKQTLIMATVLSLSQRLIEITKDRNKVALRAVLGSDGMKTLKELERAINALERLI